MHPPLPAGAWQFGATYTTANGGRANVRWGARDFLVQVCRLPSRSRAAGLAKVARFRDVSRPGYQAVLALEVLRVRTTIASVCV